MDENLNKKIFDYIKNNDDMLENVILLRLYNDYKVNDKYIVDNDDYNIVDIKVACDKLLNKFDRLDIDNNNDNNYYSLITYKNMLFNYVNNFNKKDKRKIYDLVCLITTLESYFKLPITFPSSLKDCIDVRINKDYNKRVLK